MAARSAFFGNCIIRTLALLTLLAAAGALPRPAHGGMTAPSFKAQTKAEGGQIRRIRPGADNTPVESPCAISRKQNKSLRASKKLPPAATTEYPIGLAALARHGLAVLMPAPAAHLSSLTEQPAVPPRGFRFRSRAPPGNPVAG